MSNTITVQRITASISTTAVDLPYFYLHNGGHASAILSPSAMITVCPFVGMESVHLQDPHIPDYAEQCSESVFIQAYSKALLAIEEAFYSACKSVKPAAPFLTEKAL